MPKRKTVYLQLLLFLVVFILTLNVVSAGDWHHLRNLDQKKLTKEIDRLATTIEEDPNNYDAIKGMGIACHNKATRDARKYAKKAVSFLTRAYEMNKTDYVVLCYRGSALTMMAKTTWNPIAKMNYVNKGTGFMDKAVRKAKDDPTVRMTRAVNSKSLPSFLNRGDIAMEDFEYLAEMIKKNPASLQNIKKEVFLNLSEIYQKKGNHEKASNYAELSNKL